MHRKGGATRLVVSTFLSILVLISIDGHTANAQIPGVSITNVVPDGQTLNLTVLIFEPVDRSDLEFFLNGPYLCGFVQLINYTSYRIEWNVTVNLTFPLPKNFSRDCLANTTTAPTTPSPTTIESSSNGPTNITLFPGISITSYFPVGIRLAMNISINKPMTESQFEDFLNGPKLCNIVTGLGYSKYIIRWNVTVEELEFTPPDNYSGDCLATTTIASTTLTTDFSTNDDGVSGMETTEESFSGSTTQTITGSTVSSPTSIGSTQTTTGATVASSTSVGSTQTTTGSTVTSSTNDGSTQTTTSSTVTPSTNDGSTQNTTGTTVTSSTSVGSTQTTTGFTVTSSTNDGSTQNTTGSTVTSSTSVGSTQNTTGSTVTSSTSVGSAQTNTGSTVTSSTSVGSTEATTGTTATETTSVQTTQTIISTDATMVNSTPEVTQTIFSTTDSEEGSSTTEPATEAPQSTTEIVETSTSLSTELITATAETQSTSTTTPEPIQTTQSTTMTSVGILLNTTTEETNTTTQSQNSDTSSTSEDTALSQTTLGQPVTDEQKLTPESDTTVSPVQGGLSDGAIVGIVLGSLLGASLILGLVIVLLRRADIFWSRYQESYKFTGSDDYSIEAYRPADYEENEL